MTNITQAGQSNILVQADSDYVQLVSQISDLWDEARNNAISAVNTSLLMANWQTGEYIVEFEQKGEARAKYGERLLVNLSKDLTLLKGRGFSRSVLTYMRKFYLAFPKCATVSHKLSWSHLNYFKTEICQPDDNPPIGIVLGAKKDEILMEYALEGIDNNLFAARYQLYLPNKAELQEQLDRLMDK